MKTIYILFITIALVSFTTRAQIVNIPDPAFKNRLVNFPCVDTNGDGIFDSDADTNDDGEIQITEAEAVLRLSTVESDINSIEGIQSFINLLEFSFSGDGITSFDISQNIQLEVLICHQIPITSIDISQNVNLKEFGCTYTQLTEIDLSQNINLEYVLVRFNQLTSLDISQLSNLRELNFNINQITELDISNNPNLESIVADNNFITSLDLSNNPNIVRVTISNNDLINLNLKNGNTNNIFKMWAHDNPNLTCIQVDDVTYPETQVCNSWTGWCKDETAVYSEECILGITEQPIQAAIQLYPNPVKNTIQISTKSNLTIKNIQVFDILGKKVLTTQNTNLIDVSALAAGLLFVNIETNQGVVVKKVVKE